MAASTRDTEDTCAAVVVHVPSMLRQYAGGDSKIRLRARDVRSALTRIGETHRSLYRAICDETGAVRRHVNVFVNASHIRDLDALDTPLEPGDVIMILPAVSGGVPCQSV